MTLNRPLVLYPVSIVLGLFVWEAIARIVPKALFAPPSAVLGRLAAMTADGSLPALYPYILAGMRIGLAHAIRAMVIAEMYVIVGFGGVVYNAGVEISTVSLIGALLTIMVVGVVLTELLKWLGRRTAPWYEERLQLSN